MILVLGIQRYNRYMYAIKMAQMSIGLIVKKQFHILNVFIDFVSFDKLIMKSSNSKTNDMFGWIILSNINE